VGRGARDLITEYAGLEAPSSPVQKAVNIGADTALTAVIPGAVEAARTPIRSLAEFMDTYRRLLPNWAQPQFLRELPQVIQKMSGPRSAGPILERPAWQTWPENSSPTRPPVTPSPASASAPGGPRTFYQGPGTEPPSSAPSAPEPVLKVAAQLKKAGYSDSEILQSVKWLQQGVSSADVVKRVEAARALQQTGPFAHLPTNLDAALSVAERNETGKW
jgi:hypothetical protein